MMINNATGYGVMVIPAQPNERGYRWQVESVDHVPSGENGGLHHVFVDVYNADGSEARADLNIRIAWDWNGRHTDEPAPPALLEKRAPEHMANIPLGRGQVASVWVDGYGIPSDVVVGLHTNHPDEGGDVTNGHHSFVVRFRKTLVIAAVQPSAGGGSGGYTSGGYVGGPVVGGPTVGEGSTNARVAARIYEVAAAVEGQLIDLRHLADVLTEGEERARIMGEAKG